MSQSVEDLVRLSNHWQHVSYLAFDDLQQLWKHPFVAERAGRDAAFFECVNRKILLDVGEPAGVTSQLSESRALVSDPGFLIRDDLTPLRERANGFLRLYDEDRAALPPPLWLRLLPSCLEIAEALVQSRSSAKLRFVSFAIETPLPEKSSADAYRVFVNLNSNTPRLEFPSVRRTNGSFSRSLNRSLFGSIYTKDANHEVPPYVWWGVRFRTNGSPARKNLPSYWLDVRTDTRRKLDFTEEMRDGDVLNADISFPDLLGRFEFSQVQSSMELLLRDWLFDGLTGKQRKSVDLSHPSDQLYAYVKLNATSLRHGRLPEPGIDCLICPGAFWSLDGVIWGTGMTISYGFEGEVPNDCADMVLSSTQRLMNAATSFAQLGKVRVRSKFLGFASSIHQLPQDMASIEMDARSCLERINRSVATFMDYVPQERREEFRSGFEPFELPPEFLFELMLIKHKATGVLIEMPQYLAGRLISGGWGVPEAMELVERLVRKWVEVRVSRDLSSRPSEVRSRLVTTPFPDIHVPEPMQIENSTGLLMVLVVALRSAFQHSLRWAVLSPDHEQPWVKIVMDGNDQTISILNTGEAPDLRHPAPQFGWQEDLEFLKGPSTPLWGVDCADPVAHQYSIWSPEHGYWVTRLRHTSTDDSE